MKELYEKAKEVQEKLTELGYTNEVKQLPDSMYTAQEAADAIGCEVSQIVKSIIFRLKKTGELLLVIASGINRINEKQIEKYLDNKLEELVASSVTGYIIGGVPPLAHKQTITTFIDEDLLQYEDIWAAAGHPKAVFQMTPDELVEITKGQVVNVNSSL